MAEIFAVVRHAVTAQRPPAAPFCAVLDDTLVRRAGLHTPGVAWRRDPLGPRFQTNLVRAQRFQQISAVLPGAEGNYRLVPITFLHTPTVKKPKPSADPEQWTQYRQDARAQSLPTRAVQQITQLRQALDQDGHSQRLLLMAFDGGYTNATLLQKIPPRTVCVGRIRKDAKLYFPPDPALQKTRGRRLCYGAAAPTPEQLRLDESEPWQTMTFLHAGVEHQLRFKRRQDLLWRAAGPQRLQLLVIAPLAYRLRQGGRLLYRDPAYLICTDAELDPRSIIETCFQRWDIEVNFREEKTLLGVGQAQVRAESSVESAPALTVAAYAMLLVAMQRTCGHSTDGLLPPPKWAAAEPPSRISTQRLIHQLRAEVWGRGLGVTSFSGFASHHPRNPKPEKCSFPLASAVFYANG